MPRRFPEKALVAPRTENTNVTLDVIEGALPTDLQGHVYWLSPVGNVDTPNGAPFPNRPSVINGDGMVWRADFAAGAATISSRIVKPPDYWADYATRDGSPFEKLGFFNFGMMRASPFLGARDFANTAFVPLTKTGQSARMICCYDAGRPIELDPYTLETLSPVGYTDEWRAEALQKLPFPPILATAHPFWDPNDQQFYAVNYGRSVMSMLETIPALYAASMVPKAIEYLVARLAGAFGLHPSVPRFWKLLYRFARAALHIVLSALGIDIPEDFLYLVRWDGEGAIEKFRIVDRKGKPVVVDESMHQIATTRNWIILMDTNFKLRFDQFYTNPFPNNPDIERLSRTLLASQQGTSTNVWFIRKSDLKTSAPDGRVGTHYRRVRAHQVTIPLGAVHFLADYDDNDDIISMHCAHGTALDIAEWVREWDLSASRRDQALPAALAGMIASEVDVSRLGHYRIDPKHGRILQTRIASDDQLTWGIALYAGQGVPAWNKPPDHFKSSFWFCSGLWDDLMSAFIYDLYSVYQDRLVAIDTVKKLLDEGGRASTLFRLDLEGMTFPDSYIFPDDATLSSPQFIPRDPSASAARGGIADTQGWIFAACWTPRGSEVWIFDAANLHSGPVCKLARHESHPGANDGVQFGFSMHSAYLPEIAPRTSSYGIDHAKDLAERFNQNPDLARIYVEHVVTGLATQHVSAAPTLTPPPAPPPPSETEPA